MFKRFWNWLKDWFAGDFTPGAKEQQLAESGQLTPDASFSLPEGSTIGSWLSSTVGGMTGSELTGAQQAMNQFNAEEAQKNRDWQQQMDNTKYQRAVADMRAAGVNPALMFGGASVGSAPSGSAASGSLSSPALNMSQLLAAITLPLQMKSMRAEIKQKEQDIEQSKQEISESKSRERLNDAMAELKGKEISVFEKMNDVQYRALLTMIDSEQMKIRLNEQGISESQARSTLALSQALLNEMDSHSRERLNQLNIELAEAQKASIEQGTEESKKRVNVLIAQVSEIYASALEHQASAGLKNQQIRTETERLQLVRAATTGQHISNQQQQFIVDHQEVQRMVQNGVAIMNSASEFIKGTAFGVAAGSTINFVK